MIRRIIVGTLALAIAVFLLAQLVPYGRDHSNPPVLAEPEWDSPRTRELAERACFDCHSNETEWPWYSHIAPNSWMVQRDVDRGREELNYSEFGPDSDEADESAETVLDGEMPPWYYELAHPEARFSDAERDELVQGLIRTFGTDDD